MKNKLSKEDILNLAKEKGVKLSYLNSLIGGYRGKLTDWKNGKTTLTDAELDTISNYLLGNETSGTKPTDEDIKFALFDGTEGVTDEMYDELKRFARFLKFEQSEKPAIEHTYKAIARTSDGSSELREPPTEEQMASFEEVTEDNF